MMEQRICCLLQEENSKMISEVAPRLYISDLGAAVNQSVLRSRSITAVLSLLSGQLASYSSLRECVTFLRLRHKYINIDDAPTSSLVPHLQGIVTFLAEHSQPPSAVLVHCRSGMSRSVAAVLAFQITSGVNLDMAVEAVTRVHPPAGPAPWFLAELRALAATSAPFNQTFPPASCDKVDINCSVLMLRAAAVGASILRAKCACARVRCRKCRAELFHVCASFGLNSGRSALQIVHSTGWATREPARGKGKLSCVTCSAKLGSIRRAVWKDGESAGIGRVWLNEVTVSAVDWPLGHPWPEKQDIVL